MKKYFFCLFALIIFLPLLTQAARPALCESGNYGYAFDIATYISGTASNCIVLATLPSTCTGVNCPPQKTVTKPAACTSTQAPVVYVTTKSCIHMEGATCTAYMNPSDVQHVGTNSLALRYCDDPYTDNSGTVGLSIHWPANPPVPTPANLPTIKILSPVHDFFYPPMISANPLRVSGTASGPKGIKQVRWERYDNRQSISYPYHPDAFGIATGTLNWFTDVPLNPSYGSAEILMIATGNNNATAQERMPIRYDLIPPIIAFTFPLEPTFSTTSESIKITGTADDLPLHGVAKIEWSNDKGGSGNVTTLTARTNLPYVWSQVIPLELGLNKLTFVAVDNYGNRSVPMTREVTRLDPCPNPVDLEGEMKMTEQDVRERKAQTKATEITHAFCADDSIGCSKSVLDLTEDNFNTWALNTDFHESGGRHLIEYVMASVPPTRFSNNALAEMPTFDDVVNIKKNYFDKGDIVSAGIVIVDVDGDIKKSLGGHKIILLDAVISGGFLGLKKQVEFSFLDSNQPDGMKRMTCSFTGKFLVCDNPFYSDDNYTFAIVSLYPEFTDRVKAIKSAACPRNGDLCKPGITPRSQAVDFIYAFKIKNFMIPEMNGICTGWTDTVIETAYLVNFVGQRAITGPVRLCASKIIGEKKIENDTSLCKDNMSACTISLTAYLANNQGTEVTSYNQCANINKPTQISPRNIIHSKYIQSIPDCNGVLRNKDIKTDIVDFVTYIATANKDAPSVSGPSSAYLGTSVKGISSTSRNTTPSTATLNQSLPIEVHLSNNSFVDWKAGEIFLKPLSASSWIISLPKKESLTFLDTLSSLVKTASAILAGTNPSLSRIPLTEDIASGDIASFRFNLKPTQLGLRDIQFQLVDKQGKAFGDLTPIFRFTVNATAPVTEMDNASYDGWSVGGTPLIKATADFKAEAEEGKKISVSVKMINTGTGNWNQATHFLKVASEWGMSATSIDNINSSGFVKLPATPIKPGASATFNFTITVPNRSYSANSFGITHFQPQMLKYEQTETCVPTARAPICTRTATSTLFGEPAPKMTINIKPKATPSPTSTPSPAPTLAPLTPQSPATPSLQITTPGLNTTWLLGQNHTVGWTTNLPGQQSAKIYAEIAGARGLVGTKTFTTAGSHTWFLQNFDYNGTAKLQVCVGDLCSEFRTIKVVGTTPKVTPRPTVTVTPRPTSIPTTTPKPVITPAITPVITTKPTPAPTPSIWLNQPKAGATWRPGDNYIVWGHKNFTGSETVTVKATLTVGGEPVTGDIGTAPIKAGYLKYNLTNTQITGSAEITACAQGTCSKPVTITVSQAQSLKQQSLSQVANILQTMTEMIKSWR